MTSPYMLKLWKGMGPTGYAYVETFNMIKLKQLL